MGEPSILVPLDGSLHARAALPVAKALGEVMGASLRVVHVSGGMPPPLSELVERRVLEGAALHGWSIDARVGEPSATIIDAARMVGVRLIVLCTHTAAARPTAVLGCTALGVLHAAPCPVVLVSPAPRPASWRPNRILLPHDGSPTANASVGPATELACKAAAELLVVQVGTAGIGPPAECGSLTIPLYVDQPQHEWPSWSGELLGRLVCLCPDVQLRAHLYVRGGDPGPEITRVATEESADLIVLAWKGEWTGEHAKTLKNVVRKAPCPIMILHT
jgi:nucleotide-binding universal stress UspA family protein